MKWYKHDPSAALAGMIGLTVEERGAYYTLIDLQYARAPHSDVTDELVIRALGIHRPRWHRLKAGLIAKGKVREIDGKLTANRVLSQVKLAISRGFQEATSAKINDLADTESIEPKEPRKKNRKKAPARAKTPFPEGWEPAGLEITDHHEFQKFKASALAHGRLYANWEQAWRNWKLNAPNFNRGPTNGRQQPARQRKTIQEAANELFEKLNGGDEIGELSGQAHLRIISDGSGERS